MLVRKARWTPFVIIPSTQQIDEQCILVLNKAVNTPVIVDGFGGHKADVDGCGTVWCECTPDLVDAERARWFNQKLQDVSVIAESGILIIL
jgi:hypothetical protein